MIARQSQLETDLLLPNIPILEIMSDSQKSPITAIVVCFNEETHLRESLASLAFCDEIIVADLGSTDNSVEIAKSFTNQVISIPRVQYVEMALGQLVLFAHNDWIISQDPDEVISPALTGQLHDVIEHEQDLAKIVTPMRYYFKGKRLNGTIWGGLKHKDRVFNRDRTRISPLVHVGVTVLPGYNTYQIAFDGNNVIEHYWMDSYKALVQKHWRYIRGEGESRYSSGKRFSVARFVRVTFHAFFDNFTKHNCLADGIDGVFLTLFYTWYVGMSELSLLRYQLREKCFCKVNKLKRFMSNGLPKD